MNLQQRRVAAGFTLSVLAARIGVHRNTIKNYETGKTEPTASDVVRLAIVLGCSPTDLLPCDPIPEPDQSPSAIREAFLNDVIGISKVAELLRITVNTAQEVVADWWRQVVPQTTEASDDLDRH